MSNDSGSNRSHKVIRSGGRPRARVRGGSRFVEGDPLLTGSVADPTGRIFKDGVEIYLYQTDPTLSIVNQGGAIVGDAALQVLFWGTFWNTAVNPSTGDIMTAVNKMVNSPYLSQLKQYGFNSITSVSSTIVASPAPPAGSYNGDDVNSMVQALLDNNVFPEPDDPGGRNLYIVIAPAGTQSADGGAHGETTEHDVPLLDPDTAWVGYVDYGTVGGTTNVLDAMMTVFSHELVEMISDPEPDSPAWIFPGLPDHENEIGDACAGVYGVVNDVRVASYYSNALKACVVPAKPLARPLSLSELDQAMGPVTVVTGTAVAPANSRCYKGTYSWTLSKQAAQIIVTADVSSFVNPGITWSVNDIALTNNVIATLGATVDSSGDPLSTLQNMTPEIGDFTAVAEQATLIIDMEAGNGPVDLTIVCTVTESSLPAGYNATRTASLYTTITGRDRQMDDRYKADTLACIAKKLSILDHLLAPVAILIDKGDPVPVWVQRELASLNVLLTTAGRQMERLSEFAATANIATSATAGDQAGAAIRSVSVSPKKTAAAAPAAAVRGITNVRTASGKPAGPGESLQS